MDTVITVGLWTLCGGWAGFWGGWYLRGRHERTIRRIRGWR